MLFHPKTLELLHLHKTSGADMPSSSLLALLTDYTSFIKIEDLLYILYSHTGRGSVARLKDILAAQTRAVCHAGRTVCIWPDPPAEVEEIILRHRAGEPGQLCLSSGEREPCNFVGHLEKLPPDQAFRVPAGSTMEVHGSPPCEPDTKENLDRQNIAIAGRCQCARKKRARRTRSQDIEHAVPTSEIDASRLSSQQDLAALDASAKSQRKAAKRRSIQTNILKFQKTEARRVEKIGRFAPVDLTGSTFIYDRSSIRLETVRRRDDLRPIWLQFIKHHDQRRPPIYRPRGVIIKNAFSYLKMREIISYENDSSEGWEVRDNDSAVDIDSADVSESSSGTESTDSLISADSTDSIVEEPKRRLKKPIFLYNKVPVIVYFEADKYSEAPLRPSSDIPPGIRLELTELRGKGVSIGDVSELYNIKEEALAEYYSNTQA